MARNISKFNKKSQESTFGKLIEAGIEDASRLLNAIDFIEGPQGIGARMFPVQRLIIKCMFGVPFDYMPAWAQDIEGWGMVPLWDEFREKCKGVVTEQEFLNVAFNEGRCNISDWRDIPPWGFKEAAIFAGRRGGKSEVVAAIAAFKLYLILNTRSPQEFYGLRPGSQIDFTFLAQDDKGADRLFKKLRENVNLAPFFGPYLKDNNNKNLSFVSEADRGKRDITPTIQVWSLPCTTNAVRGPSSVFLALDEFAHFRSEKGSNSDDMYAAATPATGTFKRPHPEGGDNDDGTLREIQDSLILSISSPMKRVGKMYELHKLALDYGVASDIFTLNSPTAEMNPSLLPAFFRSEFRKNAATFRAEFGGKFLESSESYVRELDVKSCVDCQWQNNGEEPIPGTERGNAVVFAETLLGRQFFWGLDLGMVNDATALAIGHLEVREGQIRLVYDYIDRMMVGEAGSWPGIENPPGAQKYKDYKTLPLQDILLWLQAMNNIMPCYRGATDQHGGQQLVQLLEMKQIHNVELVNLTPAINSQMAYALRGYIENKLCHFPYVPKFIQELKLVELNVVSKYQIKVEAPMEKGAHDDMADAAQVVAYLAQKWLMTEGRLKLDPTGQSLLMQEQMNKPAMPIASLDGVSMTDLKIRERMAKMQKFNGLPGGSSSGGRGGGGPRRGRW